MSFYADLHVHSRFSRATSQDCDLEHLARAAARKGLGVVGTGDFTHPGWFAEISGKLLPAEAGLFRLRPEFWREVYRGLPPTCRREPRFLLSAEISTIYKKSGATRKIHHLILAPELAAAENFNRALSRIGNLGSDGRPILGLDSRDLLEIALESGGGMMLIPAHIWTPWFSALGSRSGFDTIEECYGDLATHVAAVETGLSSDPPMNWRLSGLDRYRLVSNSDAHSPANLGREANIFYTELNFFAMREALATGRGYGGTIEFFPEEGKYHLDGHRQCRVRLEPEQTKRYGGRCPACGQPVTVGVLSRVEELADRPAGYRPGTAADFLSLVPLAEILSEILETGCRTKGVERSLEELVARLGPELEILISTPLEEIRREGSELLAEAVARMREGRVIREAGYDGEYGVIRLFSPEELRSSSRGLFLFEAVAEERKPRQKTELPGASGEKAGNKPRKKGGGLAGLFEPVPASAASDPVSADRSVFPSAHLVSEILAGLDPDQRAAAEITEGPLLIMAGPGTGKTRTLTHRLAHLIRDHGFPAEACLAITFTRRSAQEMKDRLRPLLGPVAEHVPVMTFHRLGLLLLSEHQEEVGRAGFRVATEDERRELVKGRTSGKRKPAGLLAEISRIKRAGLTPGPEDPLGREFAAYEEGLCRRGLVDFDDLIRLPVQLLQSHPVVRAEYRKRFACVSIDEYQDIDAGQYELVKQLCPPAADLCVIGDPDQAIYGFRGADLRFFLRFQEDFPAARVIRLTRNYRSTPAILEASLQVISGSSLKRDRRLVPLFEDPSRLVIQEAPSEKAEAEFVVHTIERMLGGHSFFSIDSGRAGTGRGADYGFSDFAVLYRTEAQAEELAAALVRSGIPFQRRSHRGLAEVPEVKALLEELGGQKGGGPIRDRLTQAAERCSLRGLGRRAEGGGAGEDKRVRENLAAGLAALLPIAEPCGSDFPRFLAEVVSAADVDLWDPRAERVSLLTLHAAKGLEFRVVFIVGCEDGLLPLKWPGREDSDLEEERRLFYVGMTRARERLFLSHARKRTLHGRSRLRTPSPFLSEIAERLASRIRSDLKKRPAQKRPEQMSLFGGGGETPRK